MGCLWIIQSLKQIVVSGFIFHCNGGVAGLTLAIRRDANCDKLAASHLCLSNAKTRVSCHSGGAIIPVLGQELLVGNGRLASTVCSKGPRAIEGHGH